MFSLCKQLQAATTVEHAVNCHFFHNLEENLVTAGANVLKVYRLTPNVDNLQRLPQNLNELETPKMRLECLASYTLHGNVACMKRASPAGAIRDVLLLSFKDAKLSVVQFDPETYTLVTLSLHQFEEEDIRGGWTGRYHIPELRVDPANRCAALLAYGKRLVVLPFRKDNTLDEVGEPFADVKPLQKKPTALLAPRTPLLASYTINLCELDDKIDNVMDFDFLHGYFEPTLLLLYEPVRTWCGRVAIRKDSYVLVAISLNTQQRVHPIIWTVNSLPFDCLRVLPVQQPISGCLIIAVNSVIYLNQSVPPYGVSVNNLVDMYTEFPLKPQPDVRMTFDTAKFAFFDVDKLVVTLGNGEIYVLTLGIDSMRGVRSFYFSKAAASVLPSCVAVCYDDYIFIGSRLGNSLLLHMRAESQDAIISLDNGDDTDDDDDNDGDDDSDQNDDDNCIEGNSNGNGNVNGNDCSMIDLTAEPDVAATTNEELEVYGSAAKLSLQFKTYIFDICDSVLNVGPINYMCVGERIEYEEDNVSIRPSAQCLRDLNGEIVATTGQGKNGALCVFSQGISPKITTTFDLPGCVDVWTVLGEPAKRAGAQLERHELMLLSQRNATLVLRTDNELNELTNTGFLCNQPTIYVANIGNNRFIVQVTMRSVRLIHGTRLVQSVPVEVGSPIMQASIVDPYVCLRTRSGQVITLALREKAHQTPRLAVNKHAISSVPVVLSAVLYKDFSGLFTTRGDDVINLTNGGSNNTYVSLGGHVKTEPNLKVEDEEDLLYGEKGNAFKVNIMADLVRQSLQKKSEWWRRQLVQVKPTYWLLAVRENGTLEIYSMPDVKLVYLVNDVINGARMLADAMEFVALPNSKAGILLNCTPQQTAGAPLPLELSVIALGARSQRPLLLIRTSLECMIYEAYRYPKGNLKLRFRKLDSINLCEADSSTHESTAAMDVDQLDVENTDNSADNVLPMRYSQHIRYFTNVGGMKGIILCGDNPCFLFMSGRGELRIHRMAGNIAVRSFAAFNNVNVPEGFLYFDGEFNLKIATLPNYLSFDAQWPVKKVPVRATVAQIVYHQDSRVYCLIMRNEEPSSKYYRFNGEDKELSDENRGERFIYPTVSQYSMVLFSPETWEIVPDTSIQFEDWEAATAFEIVRLSYEGTRSGLKEYICVGTNFNYSEDITSRGNIHIYDIIEVVPEPGKPMTKFKLKEMYKKEQKGPVSALSDVNGLLVTGLGQKIYIWQFRDSDLTGVAFIDTDVYVHRIITINSLLLVADVYKSVSLLRFQEEYRTLSMAARDYKPLEVFDIQFIIDNSSLGYLATDRERNIIIYMCLPESRDSDGGRRLLRKADYHLGQIINTTKRVQCQQRGDFRRQPFLYDRKHFVIFGTLDGGLGYCLPLPEKIYRRFGMLQNVLLTNQDHLCGLNPKEFRTVKNARRLGTNPSRCIIDGELLWSYIRLPFNERAEMAKKIGARVEDIAADLLEIERLTAFF